MTSIFAKKKIAIATHNGTFHTDDVFAVATLYLVLGRKNVSVARTRDEAVIEAAQYVVDVGARNAPEENRFDHHQSGGAGTHADGIPYAAFGLVWKKFGIQLAGSAEAAKLIEEWLVEPIDAFDNGVSLSESKQAIRPYLIQDVVRLFVPTWKEDTDVSDSAFIRMADLATDILARTIVVASDTIEATTAVRAAYELSRDRRIIVLSRPYPFDDALAEYPEPRFVLIPREENNYWKVQAVRARPHSFENRKNFPAAWGGLRDTELAQVSGVPDAVFCHRGLFMAVAKTKEGAMALAEKALI